MISPFEIEPGARVAWTPTASQTFWAAVSESSRTPDLVDANGDFNPAVFQGPGGTTAELTLFGNPRLKSEHLLATEVGYRTQLNEHVSIDLS